MDVKRTFFFFLPKTIKILERTWIMPPPTFWFPKNRSGFLFFFISKTLWTLVVRQHLLLSLFLCYRNKINRTASRLKRYVGKRKGSCRDWLSRFLRSFTGVDQSRLFHPLMVSDMQIWGFMVLGSCHLSFPPPSKNQNGPFSSTKKAIFYKNQSSYSLIILYRRFSLLKTRMVFFFLYWRMQYLKNGD